MTRYISILWFAGLFCLGAIPQSAGTTVDELNKQGLSHFRAAFYEAMPQRDFARAEGAFALAEKAFLEAIRLDSGRIESYLHLGRTLFVQEKYAEAAEIYEQAVRVRPEHKEAYLQLASAREMAGDFEKAIEALQNLRLKEKDGRAVEILDDLIRRIQERAEEESARTEGKEGRHD